MQTIERQPFTRVLGVPWFYPKPAQPKAKPRETFLLKDVPEQPPKRCWTLNWTPEEDRQIRAAYPTTATAALAKKLGRTMKQIQSRANFLGVKKDPAYFKKQVRENALAYNDRIKKCSNG